MAGARRVGSRKLMAVERREFIGCLGLILAGVARGACAQGRTYRPLARPVVIPLDDLAAPWRAKAFIADGVTLSSAATPNQPIRIDGMIVRISAGNEPDRFAALVAKCPHEGCEVDFVPDPNKLPPEVKDEIGHPVKDSVYVCPCHNSTFMATDGERMAGPAPRGLYSFKITGVTNAAVEIAEVEEDVLIFV